MERTIELVISLSWKSKGDGNTQMWGFVDGCNVLHLPVANRGYNVIDSDWWENTRRPVIRLGSMMRQGKSVRELHAAVRWMLGKYLVCVEESRLITTWLTRGSVTDDMDITGTSSIVARNVPPYDATTNSPRGAYL
ncbi:unnamed protein product [Arabidopsis arenosa]|uniref:Uncharacterized protein n=1 Tax=Arabidopsis arenosa TaxID=38785 RepID=A0A8S2AR23_ARAAE|nr:unnamed protein product [Arabidopsis arenosa]